MYRFTPHFFLFPLGMAPCRYFSLLHLSTNLKKIYSFNLFLHMILQVFGFCSSMWKRHWRMKMLMSYYRALPFFNCQWFSSGPSYDLNSVPPKFGKKVFIRGTQIKMRSLGWALKFACRNTQGEPQVKMKAVIRVVLLQKRDRQRLPTRS